MMIKVQGFLLFIMFGAAVSLGAKTNPLKLDELEKDKNSSVTLVRDHQPMFGSVNDLEEAGKGDGKSDKPSGPLRHLEFEKIKLKSFIDLVYSEIKKLNYIPNPDTANIDMSLSMRKPVNDQQAFDIFLRMLENNDYAHVQIGDICKIVKKDSKYSEPLPIFMGKPASMLPFNDETVRFVTFFNNVSIGDVNDLLKSMLSPGAQVLPLQALNGVIITDKCVNIKSAMQIIDELENCGCQESVMILALHNTNAADVKAFLGDLSKPKDGSALARILGGASDGGVEYFPPSVKIVAEERTNRLILLGNKKVLLKLEDFIINCWDKGFTQQDSPFRIYECQHINVSQIKQLIDDILQGQQSGNSSAAKTGGIRGGVKYFGQIKTEIDQTSNRLIMYCYDKNDWNILEQLIKDFDKPQPQVAIKTLIVEISESDLKTLGGQIRNKTSGQPIPGVNFQNTTLPTGSLSLNTTSGSGTTKDILGNLLNSISSVVSGGTLISLGSQNDVWALFQAIKNTENVSTITEPFMTVANRAEGTVSTEDRQRIIDTTAVAESTGSIASNSAVGYTNASATTSVTYKPQINPEGMVNLQVNLSIQNFGTTADETLSKTFNTRVTVADGTILVLGGLVSTHVSETSSKTPFLNNIPIFGWFFKNKSRDIKKSYVFVFTAASIVKPRSSPGVGLYTKIKLNDAMHIVDATSNTYWGQDPVNNWFFNASKENYSHKVLDFANARYQPTTVDLSTDTYYRPSTSLSNVTTEAAKLRSGSKSSSDVVWVAGGPSEEGFHKEERNYGDKQLFNKESIAPLNASSARDQVANIELQRQALQQLLDSNKERDENSTAALKNEFVQFLEHKQNRTNDALIQQRFGDVLTAEQVKSYLPVANLEQKLGFLNNIKNRKTPWDNAKHSSAAKDVTLSLFEGSTKENESKQQASQLAKASGSQQALSSLLTSKEGALDLASVDDEKSGSSLNAKRERLKNLMSKQQSMSVDSKVAKKMVAQADKSAFKNIFSTKDDRG